MSGMNYYREVYQNMECKELLYLFFDIVNEMKCEWTCKLSYNVSTTMNIIQCDLCEEWYHWYIYHAKECIN